MKSTWLRAVVATLLLLLLCVFATEAAAFTDPPVIVEKKKEYRQLQQGKQRLESNHRQLLKQQAELADEIERIKESDPGMFARMRLERLLAQNLEVSKRLETVARQLAANEQSRLNKRQEIYRAYTAEMENVVALLRNTKNKKLAADIARNFYELQRRREKWKSPTIAETEYSLFAIEVDPRDGPREISAKAEILEDLVKKIRTAIKRIDKQIDRLERELRLNNEMQDMVHEMNLFQEGTRFQVPTHDSQITDAEPEEAETVEDAGVHVSPLSPEQDDLPGTDRVSLSIKKEIKQLREERAFLVQLAAKLSAKAAEFRKMANGMGQSSLQLPQGGRL